MGRAPAWTRIGDGESYKKGSWKRSQTEGLETMKYLSVILALAMISLSLSSQPASIGGLRTATKTTTATVIYTRSKTLTLIATSTSYESYVAYRTVYDDAPEPILIHPKGTYTIGTHEVMSTATRITSWYETSTIVTEVIEAARATAPTTNVASDPRYWGPLLEGLLLVAIAALLAVFSIQLASLLKGSPKGMGRIAKPPRSSMR